MLMADTMAIFFVVTGLMLAFLGFWLFCFGVWQETVRRSVERCRKSFVKPFLVGLPITATIILAAVASSNLFGPIGNILAVCAISLLVFYAQTGVAGLATYLGQRLARAPESEEPWKINLRGGIVLVLSYLLPIIGWFFVLPVTFIIGCGLTTLSLRKTASKSLALSISQLTPLEAKTETPNFDLGSSLQIPR